MLDLAREFSALGHDVKLYSVLPSSRAEMFGLPRRQHRSLLPVVAPLVAWQRYAASTLPDLQSRLFSAALDYVVAAMLEPCDVFICMSGIFVRAILAAKRRYNASVWLERGSRHILSQAEILDAIPGARAPHAETITRELEGYRLADRIVVPSRHVAESFERDPDAHAKLFVNPYGTKLDMFPYREHVDWVGEPLRLLYVGNWSLQKGCDLLVEAVRTTHGIHLVHVGALTDAEFPTDRSRFVHHNSIQQAKLIQFYHEADGFILASRQDGFGMVLGQALASGLPLICTDRTGGEDLAHTPALRERIVVVSNGNAAALREGIERLRDKLRNGSRFTPLTNLDLETLSWSTYGKRYEAELLKCTERPGNHEAMPRTYRST